MPSLRNNLQVKGGIYILKFFNSGIGGREYSVLSVAVANGRADTISFEIHSRKVLPRTCVHEIQLNTSQVQTLIVELEEWMGHLSRGDKPESEGHIVTDT